MRVLIVKTSALGDILQSYPVVSYLKQRPETVEIDWVVEAAGRELVQNHPDISQCHVIDSKSWRRHPFARSSWRSLRSGLQELRAKKYDLLLDLQGNCKSACVTASARADHKVGFGKQTVPEWPNLWTSSQQFDPPPNCNVRDRYLYLVKMAFNDQTAFLPTGIQLNMPTPQQASIQQIVSSWNPEKATCLICPSSVWQNKCLSQPQLALALKRLQSKFPIQFLLSWGSNEELAKVQALGYSLGPDSTILPRLSLPALQGLMREAAGVVAMDSLPLHLAGSTETPCFGFFGPSSAATYSPIGAQHGHLQGTCPYAKPFLHRCRQIRRCPTGACLRDIPAVTLGNALIDWWARAVHQNLNS